MINTEELQRFLKEDLGGDVGTLKELFSLFQDLNVEFQALELIEDSDLVQVKSVAHKIKSSCNIFGAEDLAQNMLNLEQGENVSESQDLLQKTKGLFEEVLGEVEKAISHF